MKHASVGHHRSVGLLVAQSELDSVVVVLQGDAR